MDSKTPLSEALDKPEPQILPEAASTVKEETPPDIAGQTPQSGELTYFTDMRALSIQLGFQDSSFDGMGREADTVYNWAKKETGTNGGPETLLRIKYLIQDLGIPSRGKDLLRRVAQWTSLDTRTRDLNLRKQGI